MANADSRPRPTGRTSTGSIPNAVAMEAIQPAMMAPAGYFFTSLAVLTALFIAISGQSFWIDEANSAWRATEPDFGRLLQRMVSDTGSDAQMPLFLVMIWAWEKLAGHGEIALRAMNLVWLIPGLLIFSNGRIERLVVAGTSAFLWYYANEARPYGMQIGASLMVFGLLERVVTAARQPERDQAFLRPYEIWLLVLSLIALSGSSLLGAIWAAAAVAAAALAIPWRNWQIWRTAARKRAGPAIVLVFILTPLLLYYAWTIVMGVGGTKVAVTDLRNLGFSVYELLGAAGLGPGRNQLRDAGIAPFAPHLPALAIYILLAAAVTVAGMAAAWRQVPPRALIACSVSLAAATILILMAGYILHWRVVGRHLAPALAAVLAVQAAGLSLLWQRSLGKPVVVCFLLMALLSSVNIRFAARHAKDDYRSAAAVALSALASGERVWWNADALGALVYELPLGDGCAGALYVSEPRAGFAATLKPPNLVVTSKQDIYDPEGRLAMFLADGHYRLAQTFQAFQTWRNAEPADVEACQSLK